MKPGVYVHLPFCAVHCIYCDFPLTTRQSLADRYYDSLFKEIRMHPQRQIADTLYFGGGTPSLTPPEVLQGLRQNFALQEDAEISLEANPDDINRSTLQKWLATGINRLSIGVQSLEEPVLRWMLRKHSAKEAIYAFEEARRAGLANINVDLILGAPKQTAEGFLEGLRRLIDLRPEHFSLYLLEVHEDTGLSRQLKSGKVTLMAEDEQLRCYADAVKLMQQSGYRHYEVSNFAQPAFVSRHNMKYWTNAPYYAYGAGACSYLEPIRTKNISSITAYIDAVEQGRLPLEAEIIEDNNTTVRNALIFGLRKTEGIDMLEFEQTYGVPPLSLFDQRGTSYLKDGLMEISEHRLRLTFAGLLVSNEILSSAI